MKRLGLNFGVLAMFLMMLLVGSSFADFHQESKTQMKFKGSLGRVMKFLGMNKPAYSATYLKGNLLRTDTRDKKGKKIKSSHIIDLENEVFITIDYKKKNFTRLTFAEWKAQMEEMMGGFKAQMDDSSSPRDDMAGAGGEEKPDVKLDFKLDVNKTGNTKKIAGLNTEEVIIKITIEGEASENDDADAEAAEPAKGGMIVTTTDWKAASVNAPEELRRFYKKLAQKIGMMPRDMSMKKMFDQLKNSNPQLAAAMDQVQKESDKLKGFSVKSHTVYETYGDSGREKEGAVEEEEAPKSLGGMFGKFSKKMMKKKDSDDGNKILMESFSEVLKFEQGELTPGTFTIPANFKEKK